MKKYYVIINKWDSTKNKIVEQVAGEFDSFMNANIFANAYENYYSSSTRIIEVKL